MSADRPSYTRLDEILSRPRHRIASDAAWRFGANLLFPHVCHLARWPSRLGLRGSVAYVLVSAAGGALAVGAGGHLLRVKEAATADLRAELGREPTDAEIAARLGWDPPPAQG